MPSSTKRSAAHFIDNEAKRSGADEDMVDDDDEYDTSEEEDEDGYYAITEEVYTCNRAISELKVEFVNMNRVLLKVMQVLEQLGHVIEIPPALLRCK